VKALWTLAAAALLGACATPQSQTPGALAASASPSSLLRSSAEEMLAYLGRLRSLNDAALPAEATRQRQLMQRDTSDLARVKAALAVSVAHPADDAELLALVDPIARRDGGDADVRSMASFLQLLAAERRRQRESAAAANARVRDERRAAETHKQRADALQEKAAQLQQKLDALTEIEKSLSDRPNPR
jgi:hypothetical protein